MAFTEPRRLAPEDASLYVPLRREMLDVAPHAFLATIEDDVACTANGLAERLAGAENEVVAIADAASGALVSVAGVVRHLRGKVRHRAFVWGVYTTPSARGHGLARRVMTEALDLARGWDGVRRVELSVSADAPAAQALYESLGFVAWGREPEALVVDGVEHDEIHMARAL